MPQVGTVIADRYVLRERLGGGGTGEAWLVATSANGAASGSDHPVVVKLLADDIEPPPRGSSLIELLRQGRVDGRAYLVLEYAPGGSVRGLLRRKGLPGQQQAMSLLAQAAAALHTAHLSGLVHRDLRPEHLLHREDGWLAIADATPVVPPSVPPFRVVRGPAPVPDQATAQPLPARAGTLVSSAAARAARMPTMNPNETTLDSRPPVPPLPPERRWPQPRYLAIAGAAGVVLLALVFAVPGLASRGTFPGTADQAAPGTAVTVGPPPGGSPASAPATDGSGAASASAVPGSAVPAPATTTITIPGAPNPPVAITTVPGQPPPPAPPTAPGVVTYKVAGNGLSPEFKDGSCVYRIWYANYGSTPFGKLRIYSGGSCLSASVLVAAARGTTVSYESAGTPFVSQNTDSCGSYFEIQATASSAPAYAVGMSIRFAVTGRTIVFAVDRGVAPTVVKNC